ncbi:MAG: hypothetical protein NC311_08575 [Muribaculaceae bacterium]|nr:hypothetical protein [Muribaculaceae bacterium]
MITLNEIREDLKDIRYYYLRKPMFEEALKFTGRMNEIKGKVDMYNEIMLKAQPRMYDLYYSLYIRNHTQESLSEELGYTPEYIQKLNKRLLKYLQTALPKESA